MTNKSQRQKERRAAQRAAQGETNTASRAKALHRIEAKPAAIGKPMVVTEGQTVAERQAERDARCANIIKIAADSVAELRIQDVDRVLTSADQQGMLFDVAIYIRDARPALDHEVHRLVELIENEAKERKAKEATAEANRKQIFDEDELAPLDSRTQPEGLEQTAEQAQREAEAAAGMPEGTVWNEATASYQQAELPVMDEPHELPEFSAQDWEAQTLPAKDMDGGDFPPPEPSQDDRDAYEAERVAEIDPLAQFEDHDPEAELYREDTDPNLLPAPEAAESAGAEIASEPQPSDPVSEKAPTTPDEDEDMATKTLTAKAAKIGQPKPTKAQKSKAEAKAAKPAKAKPEAKAEAPKKMSALDAAAKVLAGAKEPMGTKELIAEMAKRDLWTSPGGATPHATLYAAMNREITVKGKESRFRQTGPGRFEATGK